jgi:hypothetical protein
MFSGGGVELLHKMFPLEKARYEYRYNSDKPLNGTMIKNLLTVQCFEQENNTT